MKSFSTTHQLVSYIQALTENPGKTTANGWYKKGKKGYDSKNYYAALDSFLEAAEGNHAEAQYFLGVLYKNGYGVDINYEVALSWYLKAAEQGNARAQNNIGDMYYEGLGVERDYDESIRLYLLAAERNDTAKTKVGHCYRHGNGVELDLDKAFEWYSLAAKAGDKEGQMNLGTMYLDGFGTEINLDVALEWFKKSLKNGYEPARVYIDRVKTRKLQTELEREAREAKEQIAKLAMKDLEIENFTKTAKIDANEDVQQVTLVPSTGIAEADLARSR